MKIIIFLDFFCQEKSKKYKLLIKWLIFFTKEKKNRNNVRLIGCFFYFFNSYDQQENIIWHKISSIRNLPFQNGKGVCTNSEISRL